MMLGHACLTKYARDLRHDCRSASSFSSGVISIAKVLGKYPVQDFLRRVA